MSPNRCAWVSASVLFSLLVCFGGLIGCGVDESTSSPASEGTLAPPPEPDDRGVNLADGSLTEIELETSFGYEAASDLGIAYFAFRDQDGNSIWDFTLPGGTAGYDLTGRNFQVMLFPSVAPRILDPADFLVDVSPVLTNKVIALVIDVSGSMSTEVGDEGTRMDVAKDVAADFVDAILDEPNDPDLISLVTFSSDARILSPLTNDAEKLKDLIDTLEPTNSTNFGAGFSEAIAAVGIQPGKRAVVFLTDGVDVEDPVAGLWPAWNNKVRSLRWQAMQQLLEYQLVTYTIGFGEFLGGNDADLRAFANDSPPDQDPPIGYSTGAFYPAITAAQLTAAFDVNDPASIPSRIDSEVAGVSSPFVSFPNDYPDQAGPISVKVTLSFENENGVLSASSTGTFIVP